MKAHVIIAILFWIMSSLAAAAQEAKLPVFYLKYDGALGSEETEEEQIEQSSNRHTVSFRIKEEFSKRFTANLLSAYSRKEYLLQAGSYWYLYVNPYMKLDISDRIRWDNAFRSKWILYDERDSKGNLKDYAGLLFNTKFTFKPIDQVKLIPSVKAVYDLHENQDKSKQTYTFAFAIDTRIETINLGGKYKAIPRFPLGAKSTIPFRFNHEFGASVTWDPNR